MINIYAHSSFTLLRIGIFNVENETKPSSVAVVDTFKWALFI